MSEMTAMRIVAGATLAVGWVAAAWLLLRIEAPSLRVEPLDARAQFDGAELARAERYGFGHALLWAGLVVAQLVGLWLLWLRRPRGRGPLLVRGALVGTAVYATLWLAALPFRLGGQWWRRRYDVSELDYLRFLTGPWSTTLGELALAAVAGAAVVALARVVRRGTWLGLWAAACALAAGYALVYPTVLSPRLRPLDDRALARAVEGLGLRLGLEDVQVEVRRAAERTRAVNAEAIGAGPTTRVILWDTLLRPEVGRGEIGFVAAHELAHVARDHLWKGVAWFCLFALPAAWLLARVVPLRDPASLPLAALVLLAFQLATLPAASALSRRYEREADRLALQTTSDPAAAEALYRRFVRTNLADPDPPWLLHLVRGTHPTLVERIATARAFAARR
ncbi:MAG TPA: M48 family metalloprotease [Gaiellaceae bacterium]|nr:M48 family metalloprotease [Gaiellaceae bacterium]